MTRVCWCTLVLLLAFSSAANAGRSTDDMLGRWDLTVTGPSGQFPSWFELSRSGSDLDMRLVYLVGGVRRVSHFELFQGTLRFVVPTWNNPGWRGPVFHGRFNGSWFSGFAVTGEDTLLWSAVRAPRLDRRTAPRWGQPITLFDGRDLDRWRPRSADQSPCWSVRDGALALQPPCADLVTRQRFGDFKLHAEFLVRPGGDSGIWLRGRYEVQIRDGRAGEEPSGATGAIYRFLPPATNAERPAGEWQELDVTLVGRRVTVVLNGATIIGDQEIPGITGGALDCDEGKPGPIMLQGTEGEVLFRNLVITPGR
jgi:hypothetical protein